MSKVKKEKAPRSYSWAITWWDENPIVFNPDTMKYLLYAPEVCPKTGKDHWQTYIVWRFQKTMTASLKNLEYVKHPHHEQCLGSYESNLNYIKGPYVSPDKSKTKPYNPGWKEFGQVPSKGQRTDLIELKDSMAKGDITVDEILMTKPDIFHLYGRTLFALEDALLRKKHRTWMTQCDWFYGPTGVGKSHHAFAGYDEKTHYIWTHDKGWWDGYNGQAIVIMNDFRGKIEYNELLQLIDKWPHKVSRRGREPTQFRAQKIIITSSLHPQDIYNKRNVEDSLDQLYRRIKLHKLGNENDDFIVDQIYSDDD